MLDLAGGLEGPSHDHPGPLQQVAGQLDVADICGVVLGVDVVVLQDPGGVEPVHETLLLVVVVDALDLGLVDGVGDVLGSGLGPDAPLVLYIRQQGCVHGEVLIWKKKKKKAYHNDNNSLRPYRVDVVD